MAHDRFLLQYRLSINYFPRLVKMPLANPRLALHRAFWVIFGAVIALRAS